MVPAGRPADARHPAPLWVWPLHRTRESAVTLLTERRWRFGALLAAGAGAVTIAAGCGGGADASGLSLGEYRD